MTLQLNEGRRVGGATHLSARIIAVFPSLALLLVGCDDAAHAADRSGISVADQITAFVADFAREALAAWLL